MSSWADLSALRASGHVPSGTLLVFGKRTEHWRLRAAMIEASRMVIDHDEDGPFPYPLVAGLEVLLMLDCEQCKEVADHYRDADPKPYRLYHYCRGCGLTPFVQAGCRTAA